MGRRDFLLWGVLLFGGVAVVGGQLRRPTEGATREIPPRPARSEIQPIVSRIDAAMEQLWADHGVTPTEPAPDLTVLRRLTLALVGSTPSLEEVRQFESLPPEGRLDAWLERLLRDRRASEYFSERFARAFVGTEDGPFLLFRRRRFRTWLNEAFHENRPYDAIVRDLIAETGLWTDRPATNFVTVTFDQEKGRPDPERLAARVSRAFLGVRLDCAQCHDHPFADWKQDDFRGLAAYFGGTRTNLRGLGDGENEYRPTDRETGEPVAVEPRVPFHAELQPAEGTPRARLAAWVVDRRNPSLARATANRVWALLFGRPLVEPVDDLPPEEELPEALTLLAEDFAAHGYDLHRLFRVIAATRAFRLDSAGPTEDGPTREHEAAWASFPLTRLRPEQVAASIFQSASVETIAADSPLLIRLFAYTGNNDFVRRYGDTGEDEFNVRAGTIPQRLLLLNGDLVRDKTKDEMFNASSLIAGLTHDDAQAVEVAYLAVLTRRPTAEESAYFTSRLRGTSGQARKDRLTDLVWTLINSTEFSWNH